MSWTDHYESPIQIIMARINNDIKDKILEISQKYSIDVDEEKLVQILKDDRTRYDEAYKKGFREGVAHFQDSIARIHMNILDMTEEPKPVAGYSPDLNKTIDSIQEWIDDAYADEYPLGLMQDALELLKQVRDRIGTQPIMCNTTATAISDAITNDKMSDMAFTVAKAAGNAHDLEVYNAACDNHIHIIHDIMTGAKTDAEEKE